MIFLSLLFIKHFIADFLLQTPYQLSNKGTYLHPGGLLHAGLHGLGTFIVVYFFSYELWVPIFLGMMDAVFHYHIDWVKEKVNDHYYLRPSDKQFWWTLGADQLLHALTYILIASLLV